MATILVLVYAGAILVLFLFVVMMIDFKKEFFSWKKSGLSPTLALIIAGLIFWQIFKVTLKILAVYYSINIFYRLN